MIARKIQRHPAPRVYHSGMTDTEVPTVRKRTLADVEIAFDGSAVIEDDSHCAACGEWFEVNDKIVYTPYAPTVNPRWVAPSHLGCAISNDEIDLTAPTGETLRLLKRTHGLLSQALKAEDTASLDRVEAENLFGDIAAVLPA